MLNAILWSIEYLVYSNLMFYILHMYLLFFKPQNKSKKWKEQMIPVLLEHSKKEIWNEERQQYQS